VFSESNVKLYDIKYDFNSRLNKRRRKPKRQSRMDNPETHAILITRHRRKEKKKRKKRKKRGKKKKKTPLRKLKREQHRPL